MSILPDIMVAYDPIKELRFKVDGWPFLAKYEGEIEVVRQESPNILEPPPMPVFIRRLSDDARVHEVRIDEEELEASREVMRQIRAQEESFQRWWNQQIKRMDDAYPPGAAATTQSCMGGSNVRAGYD